MSLDVTTSFLTYYIRSLAERTRAEKTSTKFGFDWIIYNLAVSENLIPYRLPFIRGGSDEISKTKTEVEFGIDASFLSQDQKSLTIFVLKDEVLSNSSWKSNDFDPDLRAASTVDLSANELKDVVDVTIVLAYNKDEDQAGIEHYDRLTKSLGTKIGDKVHLSFERWNLTTLTEKVKQKLLTPSLLPQKFFSLFSYICSQFGDFQHGSDAWVTQLVRNWCHFLKDLLKENADERSIRLVPVALIILREQGKNNTSAEMGWIDLAEWAMLEVWQVHETTEKGFVKQAVIQMWNDFYIAELERFYQQHASELAIEHSLEIGGCQFDIDAVAAAVIAFWHTARLGILALHHARTFAESQRGQRAVIINALQVNANRLVSFLNANPAANRPLVDLNHIELFLIWHTLWQLERKNDIYAWLQSLQRCLLVRRAGTITLPFIEGRNSLEFVFEHAATGEKPPEFCDQSSMLLLCILEFCFSLQTEKRHELLASYYREIVLGQDSFGTQMKDRTPIDLMGWLPPEDWGQNVLNKSLANEGESQTVETFKSPVGNDGSFIEERIGAFVRQSRSARKTQFPNGLPTSVIVLACLKHRTPLPAELWRLPIFGPIENTTPLKSSLPV